ncbi:hypothetical protein [Pinirhizobacter sp.]|jgi:hypothetical protein|uniref:hypothetical protein n=1 Tax=Pinirhizobacter sp. TaxID=2950432 RepID=UPI002F419002
MIFAAILVLGMLWLMGAVVGAVFKLIFGLIGGVFTIIGGLLGIVFGGVALLVIGPLVALAMLPALLPVLLVAGLVWLIVRATRKPPVIVVTPDHAPR